MGKRAAPKQEADRLPRVTIRQIKAEGFFSGKESGWIRWHDPLLGDEYLFRIGSVFIDTIDDLYPDDEMPSARPQIEGAIEFTSIVIARLSDTKNGYEFSPEHTLNQGVALKTTPCNYGKSRFWFSCPGIGNHRCRARVGVLYFVGGRLACRKCHDLTYETRNVPKQERGQGRFRNMAELDEMWESVKKYSYRGKPTKCWLRVRKKHAETNAAIERLEVLAQNGGKLPPLE